MHVVRQFGLWLVRSGFVFFLVMTALAAAVVIVFGSPDSIKQTLKQSGVYDTVVDGVLDQANKNQKKRPGDDVPLTSTGITSAAKAAFPPTLLENVTERGIDGVYSWLDGETKLPEFQIDLKKAKKDFAIAVGNFVENRYRDLPVCTYAQLQSADFKNSDVFNVKCRSPFVSIAAEEQRVIKEINSSKDFLKDPVISAQDFPKDSTGRTVFDKAKNVPEAFQLFTLSPWLLGFLALALGSAVVFLNKDRRKGLKNLSIILLGIGSLLLLAVLLLRGVFDRANKSPEIFGQINSVNLKQSVINIATSLQNSFTKTIMIFAIIYILIGGGTLVALHYGKPKTIKKT